MTRTTGKAEPIAITLPAFTNLNVYTFASLFAPILSQGRSLKVCKFLPTNESRSGSLMEEKMGRLNTCLSTIYH